MSKILVWQACEKHAMDRTRITSIAAEKDDHLVDWDVKAQWGTNTCPVYRCNSPYTTHEVRVTVLTDMEALRRRVEMERITNPPAPHDGVKPVTTLAPPEGTSLVLRVRIEVVGRKVMVNDKFFGLLRHNDHGYYVIKGQAGSVRGNSEAEVLTSVAKYLGLVA